MHYGFEVQVCNPASGHEKVSVENKAGYLRYNFFSDTPTRGDFSSLNIDLAEKMLQKHQEMHWVAILRISDCIIMGCCIAKYSSK